MESPSNQRPFLHGRIDTGILNRMPPGYSDCTTEYGQALAVTLRVLSGPLAARALLLAMVYHIRIRLSLVGCEPWIFATPPECHTRFIKEDGFALISKHPRRLERKCPASTSAMFIKPRGTSWISTSNKSVKPVFLQLPGNSAHSSTP